MTRDEALTITDMVLTAWHGRDWTKEEIDVYARLIQDMDAEITTHALIALAKEVQYRPSVAELREKVRAEKRKLASTVAPPVRQPVEIPFWVKRWLVARMLYGQFGKERDLRRFPEQQDFGDLTQETMPEGAWVAEAESITDQGFQAAFKKMLRA